MPLRVTVPQGASQNPSLPIGIFYCHMVESPMRIPVLLRNVLVALIALLSVGLQSAHADIGGITLVVYKGGWFIGGSAGHGTLNFHGRSYRLHVCGINHGVFFRGCRTRLWRGVG